MNSIDSDDLFEELSLVIPINQQFIKYLKKIKQNGNDLEKYYAEKIIKILTSYNNNL